MIFSNLGSDDCMIVFWHKRGPDAVRRLFLIDCSMCLTRLFVSSFVFVFFISVLRFAFSSDFTNSLSKPPRQLRRPDASTLNTSQKTPRNVTSIDWKTSSNTKESAFDLAPPH